MLTSGIVSSRNTPMVSYVRGRTPRTLSDADIVSRYLAGEDSYTIGTRANCSGETVLYLVRRAGHQPRPRGARKRTKVLPLTDLEIARLYTVEGLSGPTIADRCGTTAATIYAVLRSHNVPRRPSGEVSKAMSAAARARLRQKQPP
jgi:DNA-binding CsgD family transcriptional regulator